MNAVIMGRKTWFSIPKGFRPLPNRLNIIISSTITDQTIDANERADLKKVIICKSFDEAINTVLTDYKDQVESIYAIGGSQVYKSALEYPYGFLDRIYLTQIHTDVECDTFMEPEHFLDNFKKIEVINDPSRYNVDFNVELTDDAHHLKYCFEIYEKIQ
jgi:dihydrofolate reductase